MTDADLVFTGGSVYSDGLRSSVSADVAVRDGVIVGVGHASHIRTLIGPLTRVVDITGQALLPGFQDSHVHPIMAGIELLQCDLSPAANADECIELIRAYAAANPDEPWILGGGWAMEYFEGGTPTRQLLDAVVADRPVLLSNRDHHGAWANSLALELAGITASTPDPEDGRIERDAQGAPTGTLHEGAVSLVDGVRPSVSADAAYEGLLAAQSVLLSLGITSWQDAMVGAVSGLDDSLDVYIRALEENTLVGRVVAALWWERAQGLEQVAGLRERRARVEALGLPQRLRADTVKVMVDGVAENFTAAMSRPYLDADGKVTDNSGHSFVPAESLKLIASAVEAAGFQLHFHALGDRAVTESLDAIEAARRHNRPADARHQLAHLQVVGDADVPRFGELGAVANVQSLWACHEQQLDELTLPFLQDELAERQYPFGDLSRAGTKFAAGSDWPVSSPNPFDAIQVAVTRVKAGSDLVPLGGLEQALDLRTILNAYTSGGAWVNGRDDSTGRISEGYLADLVVLDRDPFTVRPAELGRIRVVSTWIDGACVHELAEESVIPE